MDSPRCPICNDTILGESLTCDGICGNNFHPTCPRRLLRSGHSGPFTCQTCADIKPCHVLKAFLLMNSALDAISDKISDLDHGISNIRSEFRLMFNDRETVLSRLDSSQDNIEKLSLLTSKIADNLHKNLSTTMRLENTIAEMTVSPDISHLKDELSLFSDKLSGFGKQLRSLSPHIPVAQTTTTQRSLLSDSTTSSGMPTKSQSPLSHNLNEVVNPNSNVSSEFPPPSFIGDSSDNAIPTVTPVETPLSHGGFSPSSLQSHPTSSQIAQPTSHQHSPNPTINWIPSAPSQSTSLYVGKCHPLTSEVMIKALVSSELLIPNNYIWCRKLVSPSRPLTDYSFVSFKVVLPAVYEQKALSHSWPHNSQVSLFQRKQRTPRLRENSSPIVIPPKNDNHSQALGAT